MEEKYFLLQYLNVSYFQGLKRNPVQLDHEWMFLNDSFFHEKIHISRDKKHVFFFQVHNLKNNQNTRILFSFFHEKTTQSSKKKIDKYMENIYHVYTILSYEEEYLRPFGVVNGLIEVRPEKNPLQSGGPHDVFHWLYMLANIISKSNNSSRRNGHTTK